jgi:hypothetical protein
MSVIAQDEVKGLNNAITVEDVKLEEIDKLEAVTTNRPEKPTKPEKNKMTPEKKGTENSFLGFFPAAGSKSTSPANVPATVAIG